MNGTLSVWAIAVGVLTLTGTAGTPPELGQPAPDFALRDLKGSEVRLSRLTREGPVVLVVLRGYPGYQCPLCTRQVAEWLGQRGAFVTAGAKVLLVYPGPGENLERHANEFVKNQPPGEPFLLVTDPDYAFTKAYGLRWDQEGETAYPSTFVIDGQGTVRFAKISKTHGGRASAAEALKALGSVRGG